MKTIRICPICSSPLPPDAPAGLCPACLLKTDPGAKPPGKCPSGEPTSMLTISPDAFARVSEIAHLRVADVTQDQCHTIRFIGKGIGA